MTRSLSQALVDDFRAELARTRPVLEAVPEARFAWKPHEKSMTIGRLAGHVAESSFFALSMMEDELDFEKLGDWKPFEPANAKDLLAKLEEGGAALIEGLSGRDDAFMSATWTMRMGDKVLLQAPRHEPIRTFGIHHLVHHRAQLTVYLRLIDVPVPATYGPTADVQSFG